MSDSHQQLFEQVCRHARQTALLGSIDAALQWDERTMMPSAGAEYRAEQITLLAGMIHQRRTDEQFGKWLAELAEGPLADHPYSDTGTTIRRLKREYDKKVKLPRTLVEQLARTAVLGQQAWQQARADDDFAAFRPLLEKTVELKRQEAEALGYPQCPYDALLDDYEPDELTSNVAEVLAGLREALVGLVDEIRGSGRRADVSVLKRNFPVDAQEQFGRRLAAQIGFDFRRGRLDARRAEMARS